MEKNWRDDNRLQEGAVISMYGNRYLVLGTVEKYGQTYTHIYDPGKPDTVENYCADVWENQAMPEAILKNGQYVGKLSKDELDTVKSAVEAKTQEHEAHLQVKWETRRNWLGYDTAFDAINHWKNEEYAAQQKYGNICAALPLKARVSATDQRFHGLPIYVEQLFDEKEAEASLQAAGKKTSEVRLDRDALKGLVSGMQRSSFTGERGLPSYTGKTDEMSREAEAETFTIK